MDITADISRTANGKKLYGFHRLEGAVEGFNKVNDKIIEKVFSKNGETVEETKKRLSASFSTKKHLPKNCYKMGIRQSIHFGTMLITLY